MIDVAQHIAGGLWATDEFGEKLQIIDQFYTVDDFEYVNERLDGKKGGGKYAFNQTGMNISGARDTEDRELSDKAYYQLHGLGPAAPNLPVNLLDKNFVHDFYLLIQRDRTIATGMGKSALRILRLVVINDIQPIVDL